MARSDQYWLKRQEQLLSDLDKRDADFTKKRLKEYDSLLNDLQKEIAYYYQAYGNDDILEYRTLMSQMSATDRETIFKNFDDFVSKHPEYSKLLPVRQNIYKLNRLEGLEMSIRIKVAELGAIEDSMMKEYLSSSYEYGYMSTMKNLEHTSSFFSINNSLLKQALDNKWFNEKNYSDRIWDNKDTLRNWITNDLKNGLVSGVNYDDLVKSLLRRMDVGKFYAKRLVWTESAFFLNRANADAFIKDGIKMYRFVAILDGRTTPTCRGLDGEVFYFDDYNPGLNAPPMHSFCRSTIVPIENDRLLSQTKWSEEMSDVPLTTETALNNLHQELAEHGFQFNKEKLGLVDATTGKVLYRLSGKDSLVAFNDELKKLLVSSPFNSLILSHNHPGRLNSSFSTADIQTMLDYPSIKALTLQLENGEQYLFDRNGRRISLIDKARFMLKTTPIEDKLIAKYGKSDDLWSKIVHERNIQLAELLKVIYKKVK